MTPKEKAKQLVDKFQKQIFFEITDERLDIEEAKGCALIAVYEIYNSGLLVFVDDEQYWHEVKQEIEKL
jgi:hypothetical protein